MKIQTILGAAVLGGALLASSTQYGSADAVQRPGMAAARGDAPVSSDVTVQIGQNYQTPGKAKGIPDLTKMLTTPCAGQGHGSRAVVNCTQFKGRHPHYVRQMPGSAHMVCVIYLLKSDSRRDYCS